MEHGGFWDRRSAQVNRRCAALKASFEAALGRFRDLIGRACCL
jgi:hypothetical protein